MELFHDPLFWFVVFLYSVGTYLFGFKSGQAATQSYIIDGMMKVAQAKPVEVKTEDYEFKSRSI